MTDPLQQSTIRPPSDVNPRTDPPLDFPDQPYGQLTSDDYATLGFMSGLEVHQQLATRSKLFCRCPSGHYVDRFDAEVLRHMRPTLSELGEYDGTALMEFKTRKEIVYQLERGTVCTYEIDDTPPFEIDQQAIEIALEVSQLFQLELVNELHVMRKQYLDGSIPTGFQRTAMMGLRGSIPFVEPQLGVDRPLRIRQLSLEEDSCREISDVGHRITFRTDRLGMPLTEVVTEPELLTPLELQAAARLVARVTRTSGRVRRGAGAARQDVNVSVAGGRRTEIKGVYHQKGLPLLVHTEGFRQLNLLRIREELHRRGVTPEMLAIPDVGVSLEESPLVADVTSALRRSDYAPLRDSLDNGEMAAALRLPSFRGTLTHRTQPGVNFANEFTERVRVIACLTGRPFMIHSDIEGYGLNHAHWQHVRHALKAEAGDSLMVLWGSPRDLDTAVREVFARAKEALVGVPAETRQGYRDGTTGFERILPGADRMYPDTDTPPVAIDDAVVAAIRSRLPMAVWEREAQYQKIGLSAATARRLVDSDWADLFDELGPVSGPLACRLAYALEKRLPFHWRRVGSRKLPAAGEIRAWLAAIADESICPEAFERGLDRILAGEPAAPVIEGFRAVSPTHEERVEDIDRVASRVAELHTTSLDAALRWSMGQIMPRYLGRLDPNEVARQLEDRLSTTLEAAAGRGKA